MGGTERAILALFKQDPSKEISTSFIAEKVFENEFLSIRDIFESPVDNVQNKKEIEKAKKEKARLHRKTLYYLNKLVEEDVLRLSKEGSKGQKFFQLMLNEGEEIIIEKYGKKIVLSKQDFSATPIEGYEQKRMLYKFDPSTWTNRLNSLMIQSTKFTDVESLYKTLCRCFSNVNDVIGLNDFESVLQVTPVDGFKVFLRKIDDDCEDYGKSVCMVLDAKNFNDKKLGNVLDAIRHYEEVKPKHIRFVFDLNSKYLQQHDEFFHKVFDIFSRSRIKLYIKNRALHSAPYILGKAGPYTFSEQEWQFYVAHIIDKVCGVACGQSSIAIDMNSFFSEYKNPQQFRSFIMNIAKVLFSANSIQRKRSEEYFRELVNLNSPFAREFFVFGRNYIRFWNYGMHGDDPNTMLNLLASSKEEIDKFCSSEEVIYQACGAPTRFNTAFSCAFNHFSDDLGDEKFKKIKINRTEDLYSKEVKEVLAFKEKLFKIFDGGERLRFHRAGGVDSSDIMRELHIILNTYNIPFFCYDFGEIKGANLKLSTFFSQ